MNQLVASAAEEFINIFGETATHYGIAPGRVEVLGNHTDYNEGFALPAAIDRQVVVVGRPIPGNIAKVYSLTFKSGGSFDVENPEKNPKEHWLNYLMSVVWQYRNVGVESSGFEALVTGDVPLGAGLSSSAAMELATAYFLKSMIGFEMSAKDMAVNCRAAENNFVGVSCGIMDQMASALGQDGRLPFLDCRLEEVTDYLPLPHKLSLVIADTNAPHALVDGAYNKRQESCFRAARVVAAHYPDRNVTHLRDVDMPMLESCRHELSDEDFRRARHVVTEDARVLAGAKALAAGDAETMGRLMSESHLSSRVDFENSGPELDHMVECAAGLPGCYGSRLSGGGFAGATVNLVDADKAEIFAAELANRYLARTAMKADVYLFTASQGASGGII
ncbi:MAG: galactokinase [Planctomycetes bacterium]|nr:galactokinase [Planctomycetota bacterium]